MTKKEIKLKYPVSDGGETINVLKMRAPKVRDQLNADKLNGGDAEKEVAIMANLCDLTPDIIGELDLRDYVALQEAYKSFFV